MFKRLHILLLTTIFVLAYSFAHAEPIEILKVATDATAQSWSSDRQWYNYTTTELETYWGGQWLEYQVELPVEGVWSVGLWAMNLGEIPSWFDFHIELSIDGSVIDSFNVPASSTTYNEGSLEITGLSAGVHTFRFKWTNDYWVPPYDANIKVRDVFFRTDSTTNEPPPNEPPTVTISANPINGQVPLSVNFTANALDSDGTIVAYLWDFGDGNTSTERNPSHNYTSPGTYQSTVTVADDGGLQTSATISITVEDLVASPSPIERVLRFQAKLQDSQGALLNGTFDFVFKLYDVETGGSPIWQESQQGVNVIDGILDVELGSLTPIELLFDLQYWLGVEVNYDGEMSPRFKLTPSPYSFRLLQ